MQTCSCGSSWNASHIQDYVANLPQKYVGGTPIKVRGVVWIRIDQTETNKIRRGFKSRQAVWVADDLSEVVVYY